MAAQQLQQEADTMPMDSSTTSARVTDTATAQALLSQVCAEPRRGCSDRDELASGNSPEHRILLGEWRNRQALINMGSCFLRVLALEPRTLLRSSKGSATELSPRSVCLFLIDSQEF